MSDENDRDHWNETFVKSKDSIWSWYHGPSQNDVLEACVPVFVHLQLVNIDCTERMKEGDGAKREN